MRLKIKLNTIAYRLVKIIAAVLKKKIYREFQRFLHTNIIIHRIFCKKKLFLEKRFPGFGRDSFESIENRSELFFCYLFILMKINMLTNASRME